MKLLVVMALLPLVALGNRFCKENTDCEDLGKELECIKSACEWGICGCLRGYAARYTGSTTVFKCVPIKKLGEGCDTKGDGGVCGAVNSRCKNDVCVCDPDRPLLEERWGGEACFDWKTSLYPTESFSASGIGSCLAGAMPNGQSVSESKGAVWSYDGTAVDANLGQVSNFLWDYAPNVCACGLGYKTTLPNDFDSAKFMGGKQPYCTPIRVGDQCINDNDCSKIVDTSVNTGVCTNNKCACRSSGHVQDITGLYCAKALAFGDLCAWDRVGFQNGVPSVGVCDGSQGLRCGDICDVTGWWTAKFNHTCVCDPGWNDNSGSCSQMSEGGSCFGDYNCKSLSSNAICVEGACQNGAALVAASIIAILLPVFAMLLKQ